MRSRLPRRPLQHPLVFSSQLVERVAKCKHNDHNNELYCPVIEEDLCFEIALIAPEIAAGPVSPC
jgi:acyl-ACP thioesterase